jgi:hypothetical protein
MHVEFVEGPLHTVGWQLDRVVHLRIFLPNQRDVPTLMAFIGDSHRGIGHAMRDLLAARRFLAPG